MALELQGLMQAAFDEVNNALRVVGGALVARTETTGVVVNTTVETDLVSFTLPGGRAKPGRRYVFRASGDLLNNSGASVNYTFRSKVGATTTHTSPVNAVATNAGRRSFMFEYELAVETTSSERSYMQYAISSPGAVGGSMSSKAFNHIGSNDVLEDLTSDKSIVLSVEMGTADASAEARLRFAELIELG